jgi:hypothetical protein
MFSREEIIENNIVFHCSTQFSSRRVLKHLHSLGCKWNNNTSLIDEKYDYWFINKTKTCYHLYKDSNGKYLVVYNDLHAAINGIQEDTIAFKKGTIFLVIDFKIHRAKQLTKFILDDIR